MFNLILVFGQKYLKEKPGDDLSEDASPIVSPDYEKDPTCPCPADQQDQCSIKE